MTHDELLKIIDTQNFCGEDQFAAALRAVVELHKPINFFENDKKESVCGFEDNYDYPCPTIQAIEKELA